MMNIFKICVLVFLLHGLVTGCSSGDSQKKEEVDVAAPDSDSSLGSDDDLFGDDSGQFTDVYEEDEVVGGSDFTEVDPGGTTDPGFDGGFDSSGDDLALDDGMGAGDTGFDSGGMGTDSSSDFGGGGDFATNDGSDFGTDSGMGMDAGMGTDTGSDFGAGDDFAASDDAGLGTGSDFGAGSDMSGDFGTTEPDNSMMADGSDFGTEPVGMGEVGGFGEETESTESKLVPVKKIETTPFRRGDTLLNAVYILRPGDDVTSVAQKIYGNDRSADLLTWNPHLHRSQKPGDKVYYQSVRRPNDESSLLFFYEDMGIPSQSYIAQKGENIREVSERLLGHERSWMEVWATNPEIESKWGLAEGTQLKYWPPGAAEGMAPAQTMAANTPDMGNMGSQFEDSGLENFDKNADSLGSDIPGEPLGQTPPDMGDLGNMPDMKPPGEMPGQPGGDMAMNDMPGDMPGMDEGGPAMGGIDPPPPPPPPQPPQGNNPSSGPGGMEAASEEQDTMMLMGVGGIVIFAVALIFIVMRKNRAKRIDLTQTHI